MASSGPRITDIKLLFARSGNQCAFPKCCVPMAHNDTAVGEICHIKGTRPNSARHDPNQAEFERHSYANLVLMCPTHHTVIDDDEEGYTVERLQKIKTAHESSAIQIEENEVSAFASLFVQAVTNIGQQGGLSAHTINASTINVQSAQSMNHLTQRRQIEAVERLWKVLQNMNNEFRFVIFIDTILTIQELDAHFNGREYVQIAECIDEYNDMNVTLRKFSKSGVDDASKERPFVTQRLWAIFSTLNALYGRSALLLTNSFKERRLLEWRKDDLCKHQLLSILSASEVETAKNSQGYGLKTAIEYLEMHFLAEAGMTKPLV